MDTPLTPDMILALIDNGLIPEEQAMSLAAMLRAQKQQDTAGLEPKAVGSDKFGTIVRHPGALEGIASAMQSIGGRQDENAAQAQMLSQILRQKSNAAGLVPEVMDAYAAKAPPQAAPPMQGLYIPGANDAPEVAGGLYIPGQNDVPESQGLYIPGSKPKKKRNFAGLPWPQDGEGSGGP